MARFSLLILLLISISVSKAETDTYSSELYSLSLEELMNISVTSTSTLVQTQKRQAPAATTLITGEQILQSGARNLDELFDIYVPGFQYMLKAQAPQMGIRGIISDRNNKMLMIVNGRVMNVKGTNGGAITERFLSMLGDIKQITVIRGPGAAVYGPGAIAGIISIETKKGDDVDGLELSVRAGAYEEFVNTEIQYGTHLDNGFDVFAYYGIDEYKGADTDDAPLMFSHDFTAGNGQSVVAGHQTPFDVANHNASYKNELRHKAHLQFTGEHSDSWIRYTRSSVQSTPVPNSYIKADPADQFGQGTAYQQLTLLSNYQHDLFSNVNIDYSLSYDLLDISIDNDFRSWREDEYFAKAIAKINASDDHKLAIGTELSYEEFGKDGLMSDEPSSMDNLIPPGTSWTTTMYSLLLEDHWQPNDEWLLISGVRADKHTYTPKMYSPRIALINTPNDRDTFKAIYNRSVRRSDDAELYKSDELSGKKGDVESIDALEFRYERQQSSRHWLAASIFHNDHSVVSWDGVAQTTSSIGDLQTAGFDLEWLYRTGQVELSFSHNFTKYLDFDLSRDTTINNLSVAPYGYGNDLANWSNHSSKLNLKYDFDEYWQASASLRIYWGYDGAQDMADYNSEQLGGKASLALYDEGEEQAFEENIYLNLGLQRRIAPGYTIRLDGFNLLGLFDDDYNKRNHFQRTTNYRLEAPAIALSVKIEAF